MTILKNEINYIAMKRSSLHAKSWVFYIEFFQIAVECNAIQYSAMQIINCPKIIYGLQFSMWHTSQKN